MLNRRSILACLIGLPALAKASPAAEVPNRVCGIDCGAPEPSYTVFTYGTITIEAGEPLKKGQLVTIRQDGRAYAFDQSDELRLPSASSGNRH